MQTLAKFRFSAVTYLANRSVRQGELPVNLYKSTIPDEHVEGFNKDYRPFSQYFELLPFFVERFAFNNRKQFVTSLDYFKDSNLLQLTILSHTGFFTKIVNPENVVPVTYGDYKHACFYGLFKHAPILDHEMIYYNKQQREFYLFDRKGNWTDVELPGLSLEKNWNERRYQDEYFL